MTVETSPHCGGELPELGTRSIFVPYELPPLEEPQLVYPKITTFGNLVLMTAGIGTPDHLVTNEQLLRHFASQQEALGWTDEYIEGYAKAMDNLGFYQGFVLPHDCDTLSDEQQHWQAESIALGVARTVEERNKIEEERGSNRDWHEIDKMSVNSSSTVPGFYRLVVDKLRNMGITVHEFEENRLACIGQAFAFYKDCMDKANYGKKVICACLEVPHGNRIDSRDLDWLMTFSCGMGFIAVVPGEDVEVLFMEAEATPDTTNGITFPRTEIDVLARRLEDDRLPLPDWIRVTDMKGNTIDYDEEAPVFKGDKLTRFDPVNHPDIGPHNFFFRTRHGYAIYLPRTEKDLYARLNMQPTLAQFQLPMARMIVGAMFRYQRDYGGSILQLNRHFSGHPANKRLTDGIMNSTHKQLMIKMGFNEMLNGAELNDGTRLSVRSLHRKTPQERQWLLYYLGQQTGDWFHYPEFGLPWVYDPSTKLRNASPVSWERHLQGLIEWGYIKPGQDTLCEVQGGGNLKAVGVFRLLDPRS